MVRVILWSQMLLKLGGEKEKESEATAQHVYGIKSQIEESKFEDWRNFWLDMC